MNTTKKDERQAIEPIVFFNPEEFVSADDWIP